MSLAHKIFTNTLWQVIIRALNILIGVFNLALITRILGQTGFGYYTTIFAFLQMLMVVADLGLYLALLREVSLAGDRAGETKATNNIFTIRLLASLVILFLSPLLINLFPYDNAVKTGVIFFSLAFFFQSLMATLTAVFSKKLAMPRAVLVDLFTKVLFFISLAYLFSRGSSLNFILAIHSIIYAVSFMLFYIILRKYIYLSLAWDFNYWREIIRQSWPLAVTVVLNLVYFKADTLILSAFRDPNEVALYGAPYRVLEVLVSFPHMFMSLLLPLLTAAWVAKNIVHFRQIFQKGFDFFCVLAVPMVVGLWLTGERVMILLAGPSFAASGPILNILILATAAIFFGTLFTYLVVALGEQKQMIKYFLTVALVGLIGYFILIPRYSYWGAAYVTLLVEVMMCYFAYILVNQKVRLNINFAILKKSLLAGFIMALIGWFCRGLNMALLILVSGAVYLLMLYTSRAIDRSILNNIFNKTKV
ncbi:MAG: hypothetical protein C3F02_01880 [Parcubacteria group bacterium]|nr:MAG: hypothetical protein C3F02_01880 [Parcubacteria group bacterium]